MALRSTGVRRTLVVFATFSGLLLSMAQACNTTCGSSSTEASGSSSRATVRQSEDSSGARYFQERQKGYDGTGDDRSSSTRNATPGECAPSGGTRTTSSRSTRTERTNGKSGNNGSAFDDGYDKGYDKGYDEGYDEGYDDGYDDGRRKHSGRSTSDDG